MKSTEKLVDNLAKEDCRKAKIDLQYAKEHIMKKRVDLAKKEYTDHLNDK